MRVQRQLTRVLKLWRLLQGRSTRPPLRWLADHLRVCPRTIRRDLEALEAAALTLKSISEKSGVVQERIFLAEVGDLLKQMAEQHKTVLAATAMKAGAGTLHENASSTAKPN